MKVEDLEHCYNHSFQGPQAIFWEPHRVQHDPVLLPGGPEFQRMLAETHVHKRGENHVYKRAVVQIYLALLGTCQAGTPTAWKDLLNASRI